MRSISLGAVDYNHNFMKYKVVSPQDYREKFTNQMLTKN